MKTKLPKLKICFGFILLFLLLSLAVKQTFSASDFQIQSPAINIENEKAEFSFYLTNQTNQNLKPKGYVELKNQAGTLIWKKEINYQTSLAASKTDKLSFFWEPSLKSLGRVKAKIVVRDSLKQHSQQEEFSFLVLPNLFGGMAAASLVILGSRSILKFTKLLVV